MTKCRGMTLIELLVVVGVIAVLMTLAAPALRQVKGTARRAECANGLRQIGSLLSAYAQDNYGHVPAGDPRPQRLPPPSTALLTEMLDGHIERFYCHAYPRRVESLGAWQDEIARGLTLHRPETGYVYLAGSRFDGWDVASQALPEDFRGARSIESVGQGVGECAEQVWMADVAQCTASSASKRREPRNWKLMSHPPQCITPKPGRMDFRLPDGANVLFGDGHVGFRAFGQLRPRRFSRQAVYYW